MKITHQPRTLEQFRRDHGLDLNDTPATEQAVSSSLEKSVETGTSGLDIQA